MTNREWLNTLDNKHFAEALSELIDDNCQTCEFDLPYVSCMPCQGCSDIILSWLNSQRESQED